MSLNQELPLRSLRGSCRSVLAFLSTREVAATRCESLVTDAVVAPSGTVGTELADPDHVLTTVSPLTKVFRCVYPAELP